MKATNLIVTHDYLEQRVTNITGKGFPVPKWTYFCKQVLDMGLTVSLYEARETYSKYVTVMKDDVEYKVRFSNHRPTYHRERNGDCDFFVGVTHTGVRNTEQALEAVKEFFGV